MGKENPFMPGSWADFERQSLDNSERAPGSYCPPGQLLSGPISGGKGQGVGVPSELAKAFSRNGFVRVGIAGSVLHTLITPKEDQVVDRVFRKNPPPGMQGATPSNPMTFTLGAVTVPKNMAFVILDVRFALYVPTGIPGNTRELEDRQLSTSIGWDLKLTDKRPGDLQYDLEPSTASLENPTYASPLATTQNQFDSIRASGFAGTAGSGTGTMPQRHRRDSQFYMPFTYIADQNQRVNLTAVVFRRVPKPISFFEGCITGFFTGANVIESYLRSISVTSGE